MTVLNIKNAVSVSQINLVDRARAAGVTGIALDVYEIICKNPGLTGGEIYKKYAVKRKNTGRSRNEIAKRVSDLKKMKAVRTDGETICSLTGRKVATWVVTGDTTFTRDVPYDRDTFDVVHVPVTDMVAIERGSTKVINSLMEVNAASELQALRNQARFLGLFGKILFFIPGFKNRLDRLISALDVAIAVLSKR